MNKFQVFRAACILGVCAAASAVSAAPPTIQDGSWTLAVIPDTQYYSQRYPHIFNAQTQFLADNKTSLNLAYVLHEGDLVQDNKPTEWDVASAAIQTLDTADVPYSLLPGNHDYRGGGNIDRMSLMADYFPVSRLAAQPTFGGVYSGEPNSPHNSYSLFSAGGTDWLVLALEFGPRNQIVDWADDILKQYPDRQAMIVTHAYLYWDDTRHDWDGKGTLQTGNPHSYDISNLPGGVNDGEEMWTQLKDNPNLQFILNGHTMSSSDDGTGYLASTADNGNVVHQMLANYQGYANGGNGYLRLLEFLSDGKTVHVRTYSPYLDSSLTTADQDFVLTMTQVPEPSTWMMLLGVAAMGAAMWFVWYAWKRLARERSATV